VSVLIFAFGFVVGGFAGALAIALAVAADKPTPQEPARLHLYQDRGARGVYNAFALRPGSVTSIRGSFMDGDVIPQRAFSRFDRGA
jgi:hypothetical protein